MKIDPILKCVMAASSISLATIQNKVLLRDSCIASEVEIEFPGIKTLILDTKDDEIVASEMSFWANGTSTDMYFSERANPHPAETPYLYSFAVGYAMLNDNGKGLVEAARANPGVKRREFSASTNIKTLDMAAYEAAMDASNFEEAARIICPDDPVRIEMTAASLSRVRPVIKDGMICVNSGAGLQDFVHDTSTLAVESRGRPFSDFIDMPHGIGDLVVAHANDCGAYVEVFINFETEELENADMLKAA